MPAPPSLGLLTFFIVYFAPCSYKMIIFDFEEEATATVHVAIATSKCIPSSILCRVQHPCQVSIALLHYWQRYSQRCVTQEIFHWTKRRSAVCNILCTNYGSFLLPFLFHVQTMDISEKPEVIIDCPHEIDSLGMQGITKY